jgi:hypothetical protein
MIPSRRINIATTGHNDFADRDFILLTPVPIKNARPIYGIYVYLSETTVRPMEITCRTSTRLIT